MGLKKANLSITGMTCANCARAVERALKKAGAAEALVNFATEEANVMYDDSTVDLQRLISAVKAAGYGAEPSRSKTKGEDENAFTVEKEHRRALILGIVLGLPLVSLSMARDFGLHLGIPYSAFGLICFLLSTPIQFFVAWDYYKGAYFSLRNLSPNMDLLVALGSTVAYVYSTFSFFSGQKGHLYFETSAMILTLIKIGKYLEAKAKIGTSKAVEALVSLRPNKARVLIEGKEVEIQIEGLNPGMLVVVRPGESIPVDGEVLEGEAHVDESMLSGESMPVFKSKAQKVFAGTTNLDGLLKIKALEVGEGTLLSKIISLVKEAQGSRAPIQRLADKVAGLFVPAVVLAALITFFSWLILTSQVEQAIMRLVAVLVIACPCALGLATPTAIVAGTGLGARLGILFKDGEALERASSIQLVVMDKTGTVTKGRPRVISAIPMNNTGRDELLVLSASLEAGSEHPVAKAITQYAREMGVELIPVQEFRSIRAEGVSGLVHGKRVVIGRPRWLESQGIPLDRALEEIRKNEEKGHTVVMVGTDGSLSGLFIVSDEIRPEAKEVVGALKAMGLKPLMLTGDNEKAAQRVAQEVGIAEVYSRVRADEKGTVINELRKKGFKVAMVGDGINDAPALAQADLGVAMGSGTDVAIQAGHVVLLGGDLRQLPKVFHISRITLRAIKQNLLWAFLYNLLLIPVAAGVLYPVQGLPHIMRELHPIMAAMAMAMSSVTVVLNSLRLSRSAL